MRKNKEKATPKHSPTTTAKKTSQPRSPAKKVEFELTEQDLDKASGGTLVTASEYCGRPAPAPDVPGFTIFPVKSNLCR